MKTPISEKLSRGATMFSLVLAGEAIFLPAFHLGRYFKTPLMTTYGLDEFQLGQLGAIYGVLATACYFLGGPLADRWSTRSLLATSLVLTGLGSFYMATFPSFVGLQWLFAYWGISTILIFWAPLIRATREWADESGQGAAFGLLDAGRGLASAAIAFVAAFVFSSLVGQVEGVDPLIEREAVRKLVCGYGVNCFLAAACVWWFVPSRKPASSNAPTDESLQRPTNVLQNLLRVLMSPAIWLQTMVIIAAYSAFKMIDNYGLYAEDAYGLTRTQSARAIAYISFSRVGAALAAGWIADHWLGVRRTLQLGFLILGVAYVVFLQVSPRPELVWLMIANMVVSCLGFFSLRGIYFAALEESGVPRELTGTAVGVISFVGFTPEIYMGPLTGWWIRSAREQGDVMQGYAACFTFLLIVSICGFAAAYGLRWFHCQSDKTRATA